MLPTEDFLSTSLSDMGMESNGIPFSINSETNLGMDTETGKQGTPDYRIRQLSYSSLLTLHSCPRKYQLYKLGTSGTEPREEDSVTFAFGTVVGLGTALVFQQKEFDEIVWRMFLEWKPELFAANDRDKKSFFYAVHAVARFFEARKRGYLSNLDLVYIDNKPAIELSFCINFPDGFRYRGYVDAVLRDTDTNKIIVLERKTTKYKAPSPGDYQNSSQAIGYSIVLQHLWPSLTSYDVLYLVYSSTAQEEYPFIFPKFLTQRAKWIRDIFLDIGRIQEYEKNGDYPLHGESCRSYFRDCPYLPTCTFSTPLITKPFDPPTDIDTTEYQIDINVIDLIDSLLKTETS